jgi:stress-induced morphogen
MRLINSEIIEEKLREHIKIDSLSIRDIGGSDHWDLSIGSRDFFGLTRIQQHQLVYKALDEFIKDDSIHALKLKTFTPQDLKETSNAY